MEQSAEIGSAGVRFTVSCSHRRPDGAADQLDVTVRDVDLVARKSVDGGYSDGCEQLVRFFEDMAASWHGWSGDRTYESIEHDLRLVATHDGHVRLRVQLWQSSDPDGWRLETTLHLEAGEQLSQAAADISAVVRG
ncbi:MAG: DUF6228 family protein [Nocardioides sp.]